MRHKHSFSKIFLLTLISFISSFQVEAQNITDHFFNPKDLMNFGTYYYPEQWDESHWERDIKMIAKMGFDFTHFGEFAWARMEPEEGKYDFSWLDKSIELAEKYGLKVILCTPSPTPPVWLTKKYTEILIINESGITMQHGTRQHVSWSSDIYREYVAKIVKELAKRYGDNETVIGWQLDNEPSHYGIYDYSPNAQKSFIKWLQNKYKEIQLLNDVWGTAFWSEVYQNFDQIRIPNPKELPVKANPHAMLDFKRFCADELASFLKEQTDNLRRHVSGSQWITTNTMPNHHPVDPARMDFLDFHTYTRYLVTGNDKGHGEHGFRIASSHVLGFHNDFYRNYPGKIYGVMELQPGQVNWGGYNPLTYPGAIRLWVYHVFAGGSKFVCNYRFRQPLKGSEQYHYGMVKTDGFTPNIGGEEYVLTTKEMKEIRKHANPQALMPNDLTARKTAILYNIDNDWEMEFQPQTWQWNTMEHMLKYYKALKRFGAPVDILSSGKDNLDEYPVVIAPAYEMLDKVTIETWKKYICNGGNLVLTARTGQKNNEAALWEGPFAYPILDLIGAKEICFDHLPPNIWGSVSMDGKLYEWNNWSDVITPTESAEVWGEYVDQFYKGKASIIHRKIKKGTVTYIGTDTDNGELEKDVLIKLYKQLDIDILDLPESVTIEWRDGLYIGLNYDSTPQEIPIPSNAEIILGKRVTDPADVVIWK
jgi:beta-galactosidase